MGTNMNETKINVRLNEQEEAIMRIIWQLQEPFVLRQLLDSLPTPQPPYTTLASIVKNIEAKGYLCSTLKGKTKEYRVLINKVQHGKASIGRLVCDYFQGSYRNLVQQFAQEEHLSPEELRELLDLIENGNK